MAIIDAGIKIQRAHVALMKHQETASYTEFFLMGSSSIDETVPTAYTDGFNRVYGKEFIENLDEKFDRKAFAEEYPDLYKEFTVVSAPTRAVIVEPKAAYQE